MADENSWLFSRRLRHVLTIIRRMRTIRYQCQLLKARECFQTLRKWRKLLYRCLEPSDTLCALYNNPENRRRNALAQTEHSVTYSPPLKPFQIEIGFLGT